MSGSTPPDVLGDVLLSLRLLASRIGLLDYGAPWAILTESLPAHTVMGFTVIEGPAWVEVEGYPPTRLGRWDTVLFMNGAEHKMSSDPGVDAVRLSDFVAERGLKNLSIKDPHADPLEIRWGEGAERTRLLLIALIAQDTGPSAVLTQLQPMILVRSDGRSPPPWLAAAVEFLSTANRTTPGYVAAASRYVELIFTSVLQAYLLTENSEGPNWVRALRDPRLGRAVSAIHARPEVGWTVETLAREAGMSRSTFARHFAEMMGQSPIDYLITHRMQLAYGRLAADRERVGTVAEALGYRSERAFRQAFKARFGQSPTRYVRSRN